LAECARIKVAKEESMAYRIATIPGDGVGQEVVPQARLAVEALGLDAEWSELGWGSDHWAATGSMMPADAIDRLRGFDAILLGAVGDPSVPDHESLWGMLLPIRQELDLWANLRPVRALPGVPIRLNCDPSEIDMMFVRENTEGEYSGAGGRVHRGLRHETAVEAGVFTRFAIARLARLAFELARSRRGRLTSATKSNASRFGYVLWDEVVEEVAADFPDVEYDRALVDALAARMVTDPAGLDVVVASNLFGDVLTDLGAAIQGGMGMAASANVAPGDPVPGLFEPVHGSAPDIAGRGVANPIGSIWSAALMLEHLGETDAARRLHDAIAAVLADGPRTRDLGGSAGTAEVGEAICRELD
jgi:tartrate dehydrogenase/decarboxylase/D-malate dehydrogenase